MKKISLLFSLLLSLSLYSQDHQWKPIAKDDADYVREYKPGDYATLSDAEREKIHKSDTVVLLEPMCNQKELKSLEKMISDLQDQSKSFPQDSVINIPVVFHVIHDGDAYGTGSNITDEQIYSAVTSTNEHLQNLLQEGQDAVDTKIQICLANTDPDGNPTNGINRVNGCSVTDYCDEGISAGLGTGASETAVKNLSRWDNQRYYNIWVVTEIENNNGGGGIQAYAYFPTTSVVDGTVILYNALGTVGNLKSYTNKNRTLTHELGHAFALFHTFQGNSCFETNCQLQGDRICDTPPTVQNTSCSSPSCDNAQTENYMDYTSQSCKNTFTQGQKERMRQAIFASRSNLANNVVASCLAEMTVIEYRFDLPETICSLDRELQGWIKNRGENALYSASFEYGSSLNQTYTFEWVGFLAPGDSVQFVFPSQSTLSQRVGMRSTHVNGFGILGPIVTDRSNLGQHKVRFETVPDILGAQNGIRVTNLTDNKVVFERPEFPIFAGGALFLDSVCLQSKSHRITFYDIVGDGFNSPYTSEGNEPYFNAIWLNGSEEVELISVDQFTFDCDSVFFLTQSMSFSGCTNPIQNILYFDINGYEITQSQALNEKTYFRHTYFADKTVKRQKVKRK